MSVLTQATLDQYMFCTGKQLKSTNEIVLVIKQCTFILLSISAQYLIIYLFTFLNDCMGLICSFMLILISVFTKSTFEMIF